MLRGGGGEIPSANLDSNVNMKVCKKKKREASGDGSSIGVG